MLRPGVEYTLEIGMCRAGPRGVSLSHTALTSRRATVSKPLTDKIDILKIDKEQCELTQLTKLPCELCEVFQAETRTVF